MTELERALDQEARLCNRCGRRWTFVVGSTDGREYCGYCGVPKTPQDHHEPPSETARAQA